ncbi:MAG: hypothetical protein VB878_06200 [Pirellulaceae bacterium]
MRIIICALAILWPFSQSKCDAQPKYPTVASIMKQFDANQDAVLTKDEVADSRYARQFLRWDADNDGKVSEKDIITLRRRFGIAADGSMLPTRQSKFTLPKIDDLPRVGPNSRLPRQAAQESAYILSTKPHAVSGNGYTILTDHNSLEFLKPLRRLADHHKGNLIEVKDLATLSDRPSHFDIIREELRKSKARYVAIAPRLESFRENMLLNMWELLSTLDDDPQIDVMPGFLISSNATGLARLVDQSIAFRPLSAKKVKPFAISQVQRAVETRSLQKSGILRNHFATYGLKTPVVAIYGQQATEATKLPGKNVWNMVVPGGGKFVEQFPDEVVQSLETANLITMHGHGVPGMSCSVDIGGLPADMSGKILLTGSCFSAAPPKSDLLKLRQAPGGYEVKTRDSFVLRAVDNGAVVAFGHQRLSSGFPHLYPVLESWMNGQTVGQAYQQLLNGLIELQGTKSGGFVISNSKQQQRPPQNRLLYVVIGDPALQPLEKLK